VLGDGRAFFNSTKERGVKMKENKDVKKETKQKKKKLF